MSLYNFHPKNAVLLDGYFLLRKLDAFLDIHNPELAEFVMNQIIKQVQFKPVPLSKQKPEGTWLGIEDNPTTTYWTRINHSLRSETYTLNALLPNGRVIEKLHKMDIISYFEDEGVPYAHSSDGMFFRLVPSLDERFLKFYDRHEYELTEREKEILVETYSVPTIHKDGSYTYETF